MVKFQSPGHYTDKDREKIPDEDFAGPHRSFPIVTQADVHDAASLVGHAADPEAVKAKIRSIAKRKGFALPDSWAEEGGGRAADLPEEKRSMARNTKQKEETAEPVAEETRSADPVEQVLYAPVTRIDQERREVTIQRATSEALDSYGTIFDYDASCDAFDRWVGNVREMHQPKAVGTRVAVYKDPVARSIGVTLRISKGAQDTWEKILDGTLKGASIGASKVVWERDANRGADAPLRAKRYDLVELSLVDNPSNPDARGISVVRNALPDEEQLDAFDDADVTRLTAFNDAVETLPELPQAPAMPLMPTGAVAADPLATQRLVAAQADQMGLAERVSVVNGVQMPPTRMVAPSSFRSTAGDPSLERIAEQERIRAREERIKRAGDAALADYPAWDMQTDYSQYLARKAAVRGAAESAEVQRIQAGVPELTATAESAESRRDDHDGDGDDDHKAQAREDVALKASQKEAAKAGNPEEIEGEGENVSAAARSATLDGQTPRVLEHTHADGTTHTHAVLRDEHSHIYRAGAPLDAALLQLPEEQRAAWDMTGKAGFTPGPQVSGSAQKDGQAVSPMLSVTPSAVGHRDLVSTFDAEALDFGVPPRAPAVAPTPDGSQPLTLDASTFHEGGHQPMASLNGGDLDRERVDATAQNPSAPEHASSQPVPELVTSEGTEGVAPVIGSLHTTGRADIPAVSVMMDNREESAPSAGAGSPNSAPVSIPTPGADQMADVPASANVDSDGEGADFDGDSDDIMISSRQPAGSKLNDSDRRPTKNIGRNPKAKNLQVGESGSFTSQISSVGEPMAPKADGMRSADMRGESDPDETRVGARISSESRAAIHDMRRGAFDQARSACAHCGCPECAATVAALDNIVENATTPQAIARSAEEFAQARVLSAIVTRALEEKFAEELTALRNAVAQRFTDLELTLTDSTTTTRALLSADTTRALPTQVTAAVASAVEPINQQLSTLAASFAGVAGDVERIANQPAATPPAWSGIADNVAHKTLPGSVTRSADSVTDISIPERISVLQAMAQRSTNPAVQAEVAAEIMQLQRSAGGGQEPVRPLAGGHYRAPLR